MTDHLLHGNFSDFVNESTLPPTQECVSYRAPGPVIGPFRSEAKVAPIRPQDPSLLPLDNAFPKFCGNEWRNITKATRRQNRVALNAILDGKPLPITDPNDPLCTFTDCNIAAFMGVAYLLREQARAAGPGSREMRRWFELKHKFRYDGEAHDIFRGYDMVETFATKYGFPEVKTPKSKLNENAAKGIPKPGDLILFQRNEHYYDEPNSAHSSIFSHYQKDSNGNVTHVCAWSTFAKIKGFGVHCESITYLNYISSATLKL